MSRPERRRCPLNPHQAPETNTEICNLNMDAMKNELSFALRAVFAKINPHLFRYKHDIGEITDVSGLSGDNKLVFVPEPRF